MTSLTMVDVSRPAPPLALIGANAPFQRGDAAVSVLSQLLTDAAQALNDDHASLRSSLSKAVALLAGERDDIAASAVSNGLAPWQAKRALAHIDAHLDSTIRIEDLSTITRQSKSYFSRAFKATFGRAPQQFILERRVSRAQELMLSTDTPLCDIAGTCGFSDQAHFSRVFRRTIGTPPHAWRRARRASASPGAWRRILAA